MNPITLTRSVRIERPASEVFDWHERPGAFERLAPPWQKLRLVSRSGGITDGSTVRLRTKIGPLWVPWDVEHRDYVRGVQFRDVQLRGPFAQWEHLHHFAEADQGRACILTDEVTYRLPLGVLGRLGGGAFARAELERLFDYRHALTRADLEGGARPGDARPLRFLISGASGLIGRTLTAYLQTQGHTVVRLVRRPARGEGEVSWNPAAGTLDPRALRGVDVVVNLSGVDVSGRRWSHARKKAILDSRVDSTRTLVMAMKAAGNERSHPLVFLSSSGVGAYGSRGDELLDEGSSAGDGFLADVCAAWEHQAASAEALGVRTVRLRTGVVLTPAGGALAKMLPVFKAGLGGPLGPGSMWMSWISIDDVAGAILHAAQDPRCTGPVNLVAPEPVTSAEFARTLARVLRRPGILPAPAVALRLVFGEMAADTVLSSARVAPRRLLDTGYRFRHRTLEDALRMALGRLRPGQT